MAGPIRIAILGNAASAVGSINATATATNRLGTSFKGAALAAAKFAAVGTALGAGLAAYGAVKFAKAAAEDQQAATLMAKSFRNAAGATKGQIAATESWISAQGRALGVTDDQLRPALSRLVTATGSVAKSQKLASLAMKVSAGTGKSLESVSTALAKAQNGSLAGLSRLGVATKNAAGETLTLGQVTKQLGEKFAGAAKAKANTFQGQLDRLKLIATEAGESIGYKLIPYLTQFAGWLLSTGVPAMSRFGRAAMETLGPPIRAAAAAIGEVGSRVIGFVQALRSGEGSSPFVDRIREIGSVIMGQVIPGIVAFGQSVASQFLPVLQTAAQTFTTVVLPAVTRLASYLAGNLMPIISQVAGIIRDQVIPILTSWYGFLASQVYPAVIKVATAIGTALKPVFDALFKVIQTSVLPTIAKLLAAFREHQPTIEKVIGVVIKVTGKVLEFAAAILGKVLPPAIRFAGFLIGTLVPAVVDVIGTVVKVIAKVIDFGQAVVERVKDVAEFVSGLKEKFGDALDYVKEIPGKIKDGLGQLGSLLLSAGGDVIRGFISGMTARAGDIISAIKNTITDALPGYVKKALGIESPSKVFAELGMWTMLGFAKGVEDNAPKVLEKLQSLREGLKSTLDQIRSDFDSIATSISSAFTGSLFDAATGADFVTNLLSVKGNLKTLQAAFKKLVRWGVPAGFLTQLFSSGNGGLIIDLAQGSRSTAFDAFQTFNSVNRLSDKLGGSVARNQLGGKLDVTNDRLQDILRAIRRIDGPEAGKTPTTAPKATAWSVAPATVSKTTSSTAGMEQLQAENVALLRAIRELLAVAPDAHATRLAQVINETDANAYAGRIG